MAIKPPALAFCQPPDPTAATMQAIAKLWLLPWMIAAVIAQETLREMLGSPK